MKTIVHFLLMIMVVGTIHAQVSEKDIESVQFLQFTDQGNTTYGFSQGDILIGPSISIKADGNIIYTNYEGGMGNGIQMLENGKTGVMILQELKDNLQHGNGFKMVGTNVEYAYVYKKGKVKKIMHQEYKQKVNNISPRCVGNCMGGFGLKQTSDGSQTVIGFFDSGDPENPVIHVFDDGDMYTGGMKKWKRNGFGKYKYANDNSYYVGIWKNNKRHGLGIWFNSDGTIRKKGFFKKDELVKNM